MEPFFFLGVMFFLLMKFISILFLSVSGILSNSSYCRAPLLQLGNQPKTALYDWPWKKREAEIIEKSRKWVTRFFSFWFWHKVGRHSWKSELIIPRLLMDFHFLAWTFKVSSSSCSRPLNTMTTFGPSWNPVMIWTIYSVLVDGLGIPIWP